MAYTFTRSGSESIRFSHVTSLDELQKLTVSMWVKSTGVALYDALISQKTGDEGLAIYVNSDTSTANRTLFVRGYNVVGYNHYKNEVLTYNDWHHLYVVYDGSLTDPNRVKAWIDGTAVSGWNFAEAPSLLGTATGQDFTIGEWSANDVTTNSMSGALAEVAMWIGEAITDSTLIANLAAGRNPLDPSNGRPTGLDWYAPLRSDAVEVINDETGTVTGVSTSTHPSVDDLPSGGGSTPGDGAAIIMVL